LVKLDFGFEIGYRIWSTQEVEMADSRFATVNRVVLAAACLLAVSQATVARAEDTPKAPEAAPEAAAPPSQPAEAPVSPPAAAAEQPSMPAATVQNNMNVGLDYTLTVEGAVVDTTKERGPFHYVHGKGQLIPGLERELTGLHVGDSKKVTVSPADGYGEVDPAAFVEVPKTQLPKDMAPTVGMILRGVNPDGKNFRAKINEIKDTSVVLDLNHPLAGKTLNFQVKVTDIAPVPVAAAPSPTAQ